MSLLPVNTINPIPVNTINPNTQFTGADSANRNRTGVSEPSAEIIDLDSRKSALAPQIYAQAKEARAAGDIAKAYPLYQQVIALTEKAPTIDTIRAKFFAALISTKNLTPNASFESAWKTALSYLQDLQKETSFSSVTEGWNEGEIGSIKNTSAQLEAQCKLQISLAIYIKISNSLKQNDISQKLQEARPAIAEIIQHDPSVISNINPLILPNGDVNSIQDLPTLAATIDYIRSSLCQNLFNQALTDLRSGELLSARDYAQKAKQMGDSRADMIINMINQRLPQQS